MAVRNFWVEADIDGRSTKLAGGPAAKNGGMTVVIKQREECQIITAFKIVCREYDGNLCTTVIDREGNATEDVWTMR